jgi:hypothetical protein
MYPDLYGEGIDAGLLLLQSYMQAEMEAHHAKEGRGGAPVERPFLYRNSVRRLRRR